MLETPLGKIWNRFEDTSPLGHLYLDLLIQLEDLLADWRTVNTDGAAATQLETEPQGGLLQLPDHVKLTLGLLVEVLLVILDAGPALGDLVLQVIKLSLASVHPQHHQGPVGFLLRLQVVDSLYLLTDFSFPGCGNSPSELQLLQLIQLEIFLFLQLFYFRYDVLHVSLR